MSPGGIVFLALFIPGLVMIALVVAVALPRALRDLKAQPPRESPPPPVSDDPPDT
jgi:hypothetical protein